MWITKYWLSNSCTSLVLSSDVIQIRNLKIIIIKKNGTKSIRNLINWNENIDKIKKLIKWKSKVKFREGSLKTISYYKK